MRTTALRGFRLSFQQERLWRWSQENQLYHGSQCAIKLEGPFDPALFHRSLQQVVDQYEILRTTFYTAPGMEQPVQVLGGDSAITCPLVDVSHLDKQQQNEVREEYWHNLQLSLSDLEQGPLLQSVVLRLSAQCHVLLLHVHALIADACTLKLLVLKLLQTYEAYHVGKPLLRDEDELQYIDISSWQYELLQDQDVEQQQTFWRKLDLAQLANIVLPLQPDSKNSWRDDEMPVLPPQQVGVLLDAEQQALLMKLCQYYQVSPEAFLLACWQMLLWRLTGENPLIGLAGDGRPDKELEAVFGPGLWTVPFALSTSFSDQLTGEWLIKQTQQVLQEVIEKQLYFAWEAVVPELELQEQRFSLGFSFETWPLEWRVAGLKASLLRLQSWREPMPLQLQATQQGELLHLHLLADPFLYSQRQVERLATLLQTLLQQVLASPEAPIGQLSLLNLQEQREQQARLSGPGHEGAFVPLHQLFEAQARQHPTAPAVRWGEEVFSYQQVERQANRFAHLLIERGVQSGERVALCLPRGVWAIIGLLAVLKAGGCYVFLEPEWPVARLRSLLQDLSPRLVLSSRQVRERMPDWRGGMLLVEELTDLLVWQPETPPLVRVELEDLAYIMYTSGSTGTPKGVMIQQRSVSNYTQALCQLLGCEAGWQVATVSSLAADLGNTAIFCGLASGGCVHLLSYEQVTDAAAFSAYVQRYPLDMLKIVPSHLQALLADATAPILPRHRLILGGEALSWSLLKQIQQRGGECELYNHYGPTEATIGALVQPLGQASELLIPSGELRGSSVPIGRAIANVQPYILDAQQHQVPAGVNGELYLGGVGLAAGYWQDEEQTSRRFVQVPIMGQLQRLYCTGDRVREMEDGRLQYVGRQDGQVKLRGYRIELGEIEERLRRLPQVRQAAVQLWLREQERGSLLVGYIVPWKKPGPSQSELLRGLSEQLPEYMLPAQIMMVERLPLTVNGKLDRQRLPLPETHTKREAEVSEGRQETLTPIEEVLASVWEEVLGLQSIDRTDNFFRLGGHSLLGTRLIARLRAVFGVEVHITWLFESPTIAQLAPRLEVLLREGGKAAPPLVPVPRTGPLLLSYAQQRLWFVYQLDPQSTAYTVPGAARLQGDLKVSALQESFFLLQQRHESLRTSFPVQQEQPVQQIAPAPLTGLPLLDLSACPAARREEELQRLVEQETQRPFDLAAGPLCRACLLKLAEQDYVLLLSLHHIISDGWSINILVRELSSLYQALVKGEPSALAPLPIQYADYACWQRQWLQGEVLREHIRYWTEQLSGARALQLPTDAPRPAVRSTQGSRYSRHLDAELTLQLQQLSRQEGMTLFMTLLAGFQVLLARLSGQSDVLVGTDSANRSRIETEGLIGFFVNVLALRTRLQGNPMFRQVLRQVREMVLGAYMHQELPFEMVVEHLRLERESQGVPLINVLFVMQNFPTTDAELPAVQVRSFSRRLPSAKFDLALFVTEDSQGLHISTTYSTDLFKDETIAALVLRYEALLRSVVAQPDIKMNSLDISTHDEKDRKAREQIALRQNLRMSKGGRLSIPTEGNRS